jgi:hypothetical protein
MSRLGALIGSRRGRLGDLQADKMEPWLPWAALPGAEKSSLRPVYYHVLAAAASPLHAHFSLHAPVSSSICFFLVLVVVFSPVPPG